MANQPQESKIGEVKFRRKLIDQHLGHKVHFKNVPDNKQILAILKERVKNSRVIFKKLKKAQVNLSPFLEIGAEKCQRTSLLTSEFNAHGFALDLSYESLKSAKQFAEKLNLKKTPVLICADAENLPFKNSSLSFVFAFETLHHFPNPKLALSEMERVAQETVYFSEEPVSQIFNFALWRRDYNLTSFEKLMKYILILPLISKLGGAETGYKVLENEFSLETWQKALKIFTSLEITLKPIFIGPEWNAVTNNIKWNINPITRALISLEGGGITAKATLQKPQKQRGNIFNSLQCPNCKKSTPKKDGRSFVCMKCHAVYPTSNNVIFLLTPKLRQKLYPNII